jgi:hypothetical protein
VGPGDNSDFATVAYNAATGKQLWVNLYVPRDLGYGGGGAVAASPHGDTVYMTSSAGVGWTTIAYNAITGQRLWVSHYHDGHPLTMALSPHDTTVYVTGRGGTVAYDAATGKQLWAAPGPVPDRTPNTVVPSELSGTTSPNNSSNTSASITSTVRTVAASLSPARRERAPRAVQCLQG